ncbi:sirohydrochlorin chelatase [Halobacillus sp. BBL2006]|uniref:sirohydrochlorin chelatase n=1 Tax=Halobacillus sp. BBL2006 TaxID=1543706 RepID=UPI000543382D|nr:sirohydrochlorin chelatase [Halobacillus sp. BBL2006]KHE70244.1 sirohydrochlorin ferrochelatase [Halobacillus sp. BBL2006]
MKSVLYVSHGSRVEETREEAVSFLHAVHEHVDVPLWGICFLELTEPDMRSGIERLIKHGATEIAIVPVLLLSAGHYYKDIPEEITEAMSLYPNVKYKYGKPIGIQDRIIDVLDQRVRETESFDAMNTDILLVGRGSKNPETKRSIETIARRLEEKLQVTDIEVSYLAACRPSFEEGLERALKKESETIVVPYLWFTGLLIKSMTKKVNQLQEEGHGIKITHYLGNHLNIVQALADRAEEAVVSSAIDKTFVTSV